MGSPNIIYNLIYNNAVKGVLIKGVLKFSGFKKTKWFKIGSVQSISNEKRTKWLADIKEYMKKL